MIAMLIADARSGERQAISREAHEQAALQTNEYWEWVECGDADRIRLLLDQNRRLHMACLDITAGQILETAGDLRTQFPELYMILIADMTISPTIYMRPTIGAESLLLRPLTGPQIRDVLSEAVAAYKKRFLHADERKFFVLETQGMRELIDYDRICYFESREKRLYCNTGDEEFSFYGTLDGLEEKLDGTFLRCHRSFLVNAGKIDRIFLSQNVLELKGDIEVPLSRTCKPAIREFMKSQRGQV